jgi:hypothetical protein
MPCSSSRDILKERVIPSGGFRRRNEKSEKGIRVSKIGLIGRWLRFDDDLLCPQSYRANGGGGAVTGDVIG